jgi:hypothetical protein
VFVGKAKKKGLGRGGEEYLNLAFLGLVIIWECIKRLSLDDL